MDLARHTLLALSVFSSLAAVPQRRSLGPVENDPGGPCDTAAWKLVFHDEFDGTALDPTKWVTYFTYSADGSDQCPSCRVMGTTNNIFRTEQVKVDGGLLSIGVEHKPGEWYGQRKEHESGMIHSIGNAHFDHGRFEIRCKIPTGAGLWPAFWGFGGQTEIDVFEFCGERPRVLVASLHRWSEPKHSSSERFRLQDLSQDFHTYAVEWEGDELRWYVDDRLVHRRTRFVDRRGRSLPGCDRLPADRPTASYYPRREDTVNLIVNLAVSEPKGFCRPPEQAGAWQPNTALVVDHVRVYQRRPGAGLKDLCTTTRVLRPITDEQPKGPNEVRAFQVTGPDAPVTWRTSPGLEVLGNKNDMISVRVRKGMRVPQWIVAEVDGEPCAQGPLAPRIDLPVAR